MKLTAYQRRQVDYVKANHPCYPKRKTKVMNKRDLAELEADRLQWDGKGAVCTVNIRH